jgi:hypothetical protein
MFDRRLGAIRVFRSREYAWPEGCGVYLVELYEVYFSGDG